MNETIAELCGWGQDCALPDLVSGGRNLPGGKKSQAATNMREGVTIYYGN